MNSTVNKLVVAAQHMVDGFIDRLPDLILAVVAFRAEAVRKLSYRGPAARKQKRNCTQLLRN
jgi:hypothetical protein